MINAMRRTERTKWAVGTASADAGRMRLGRLAGVLLIAALTVFPTIGHAGGHADETAATFLTARFETASPRGFDRLCSRYSWLCQMSQSRSLPSGAQLALARRVNLNVNRTTPQITDRAQYGVDDYWALPTRRGGDCEDIALLKKKLLVRAGFPAQDLMIATVLDRSRDDHAVLVARTALGDFVLDNLTDKVLPWERTGYTFLTMQNPHAPRQWDAVLRGGLVEMRLASN